MTGLTGVRTPRRFLYMNMTIDFPAIDNRPVTEAHARLCRERGHATHTVDGADTGTCPRCGEAKPAEVPLPEAAAVKFETLLDLEAAVRGERVSVIFAPANLPDYLKAARHENLRIAKANLFAAVDKLTIDEARAYGVYRQARG